MRKRLGSRHRSRRAASMTAVAVLLAAALSSAIGGSVIGARQRRPAPSLVVMTRRSFTVRGRHFKPRISVRLTLMAARSFSRHARPNARGAFTITFPPVVNRCTAWSMSARQGRLLVVVHGPKPKCAPVSTPCGLPATDREARNTPGGPDPWGGCFPGPNNTGVPAGIDLVTVTTAADGPPNAALPSDNQGWQYVPTDGAISVSKAGAVIDGVKSTGVEDYVAGGSYALKNSEIDGVISSGDSYSGHAVIEHSTINGGSQSSVPTVGVPNVDVEFSNLYGGKDEVNCEGDNCTVRNSWLHDNYTGDPNAHQQGFFEDGNSNDVLTHDSIFCTGGCTADITLATGYPSNSISVSNNLLVASRNSVVCVYAGPNTDPLIPPGVTVANVSWTNNVFQRGTNGQCGYNGPVYGWYPSQCTPGSSCSWSGNVWDDGKALNERYR